MTDYYNIYARSRLPNLSSLEMRRSARELRLKAPDMLDSNDRDTLIRLADGYERRAAELEHRRLRASVAR
jgi:hypothetical protein